MELGGQLPFLMFGHVFLSLELSGQLTSILWEFLSAIWMHDWMGNLVPYDAKAFKSYLSYILYICSLT